MLYTINGNASHNVIYKKHSWVSVHRWRNVSVDEAFLKAEKLMSDDFNVAGELVTGGLSRVATAKLLHSTR